MRMIRPAYPGDPHDLAAIFHHAADRSYVRPCKIGWAYGVAFVKPRWANLTFTRKGWRPTKKWAAKVAVRIHTRYRANYAASTGKVVENAPTTDAFDVLADDPNQIARTKQDLKRIAKDLENS